MTVGRPATSARPAHHLPELDCWAITGYAEVTAALHDYGRFSSVGGNGHQLKSSAKALVALDPPGHALVRRPVARAFSAARVDALEKVIATTAATAIGRALRRGSLDVVADLAEPVAVASLAALLGLESERLAGLRQGHSFPGGPLTARWRSFFESLVAARRRSGGDDLITDLLADGLADEQVVEVCLLLLVAGWDTPRDFIAAAVFELAVRGVAFSSEPGLVDELARIVSPVQAVFRTATQDIEDFGAIPAGSRVLLSLASANVDSDVWNAPDDLAIGRPARHVGFGAGPHACVGARLARVQLSAVLEALNGVEAAPLAEPRWSPVPSFRRMRSGELAVSRPPGC